jgi:hypothetical protein
MSQSCPDANSVAQALTGTRGETKEGSREPQLESSQRLPREAGVSRDPGWLGVSLTEREQASPISNQAELQ